MGRRLVGKKKEGGGTGRTEEIQQRSAGQCQTAGGALEEETQERGEGFDGGQVGKWQIQMWCKAQLQTGESPEGAAELVGQGT